MEALETRAEIAANQDFYLTRLPLTGEVLAQFEVWVEAARTGKQATKLVKIERNDEFIGVGYEFDRSQSAVLEKGEHTPALSVCRSSAPRCWPRARLPPWSGGWRKPRRPIAA